MWVEPVVLEGLRVRLEPLSERHVPDLSRHLELELFQFFAGLRPACADAPGTLDYVRQRMALSDISFAMVLRDTGEAIGHTSFMEIREAHRALEIGSTWIGRAWQRTFVNPEVKLLMLTHAFESLGCVRVQLKTDLRNTQSQRGIEKLGAVREGVLRRHQICADGHIRDTVMYSITDGEWPSVKTRLEDRLLRA